MYIANITKTEKCYCTLTFRHRKHRVETGIDEGNPFSLAQAFRQVPRMRGVGPARAQGAEKRGDTATTHRRRPGRLLRNDVQPVELQKFPFSKADQRPRPSALHVWVVLQHAVRRAVRDLGDGRDTRELPTVAINGTGRRRRYDAGWTVAAQLDGRLAGSYLTVEFIVLTDPEFQVGYLRLQPRPVGRYRRPVRDVPPDGSFLSETRISVKRRSQNDKM